jgi:hypothetical protein
LVQVLGGLLGACAQIADTIKLPRLLGLGGERRGEEAGSRHDEGTPVHYSIT